MDIFQTIWTAFTTENEIMLNIIGFFSCFIEVFVNMLFFTTLLDIKTTKKSKYIYVFSISILAFLSRTIIPDPYGTIFNLIIGFLLIKFIFKTSWLKSTLAEFVPSLIMLLAELCIQKICLEILNLSYEMIMLLPISRLLIPLIIYLCIYIIYRFIKFWKFNINLEIMTIKNRILFIVNTLLGIIAIATQIFLMAFYSQTMPVPITIISILSLSAYFFISFYSLLSTSKLENTSRDLETAQLHNRALIILHDNLRGFKHDFHNIVQGIGGYADKGDLEGLKRYYKQLLEDCNKVNNLTTLNPELISNPSIYNVLADKYYRADKSNIQINLEIFMDLNEIEKHMKIYEFTRIFGILLDNAIDAAADCEQKIINVTFRKETNKHRLLMIIENTYKNKDINIDEIFEKDFTTKSKKTNSGLGLWEVRQILKKNNNLNLFTTKNEEFFVQQFEIYY